MPTPKAKKPAAKADKKTPAKITKPAVKTPVKPPAKTKAAPKAKTPSKPVVKKPAAKVTPKKAAPKAAAKTVTPKAITKKSTAKTAESIKKITAAKAAPAKVTPTKKTAPAKLATKAAPAKAASKTTTKASVDKPKTAPTKTSNRPIRAKMSSSSDATLQIRGVTPYTTKKGEEYMSKQQLAHFTEILNGWKRELMEEVDRTVHHMQDEAANYPDLSDRASQEEEFSLELRARDRERKLIKKINETLERIEKNDYGYCDSCGVEIGVRRLEARPTATLCIDCKTLDEIKEKQIKG